MGDRSRLRHLRIALTPLLAGAALGCSKPGDPGGEVLGTAYSPDTGKTCLAIQRGVGGSFADAQIASGDPARQSKNYGSSTPINAGVVPGAGGRQTLLRFDLSAIPPGAAITSATLSLATSSDAAATVRAHRVTAAWSEGTVTWDSFAAAFAPAVEASFANGGPAFTGVKQLDLKALTQSWVNGAVPNQGVLLEQDPVGRTSFVSSEGAPANQRPRFDVCYQIPSCNDGIQDGGELGVDCGGPCAKECPHPSASEIVNGGELSRSAHYKAVYTVGQPSLVQGTSKSASYRQQGGLVGANGSMP